VNERAARGALRWLAPALTVVLVAVFARSVDWATAWSAISHADAMLLLVATAANLASLAVKGIRWWLFLDAAGVPGVAPAIRATVVGAALNNVLIANGGDAARIALVARRRNVSSARVLATLALDRLGDAVSYAGLFVAAAFVLPLPAELARWRLAGSIGLTLLVLSAAALIWRGDDTRPEDTLEPVAAGAGVGTRARAYWRRLVATSTSIASGPRMAMALALSFVGWAGQWATFHYAARSAAFPISGTESLLALLTVNASFLIRMTPGNVGVFQLLYALAAGSMGLDKNRAVAVAFLIQMIQYIPVTLVGLLLAPSLARRDVRTDPVAPTASPTAGPKPP